MSILFRATFIASTDSSAFFIVSATKDQVYPSANPCLLLFSCIVFGPDEVFAPLMPVPETSINKNYRFIFRKNDVWFARKPGIVLSVTKPLRKQVFAHQFLRLGILATDTGHIIAPFFG